MPIEGSHSPCELPSGIGRMLHVAPLSSDTIAAAWPPLSSGTLAVVLPAGVSPSSCDTNVRPVVWSVNRIGSPKALGVDGRTTGFCSQVASAGDWQSLNVTLTM